METVINLLNGISAGRLITYILAFAAVGTAIYKAAKQFVKWEKAMYDSQLKKQKETEEVKESVVSLTKCVN